ncbi:unnamed protein product [Diatraea saccharalis]|uniref:Saccharopine dehydrogenase NADP binding domain-containing protein n=1 Tax=Diatraea saccharalis TaxID=40085 RepID=A0A9N9R0L5_9NEOP|nr:unnamed protein product [Diatraea saccharalis]
MDRLDVLIVGATGFTGKHAVKNLIEILKGSPDLSVSWGITGRSKEKLDNVLSELEEIGETKTNVTVIKCDVEKDDLRDVTGRAKVVINCTGPNTILSEPIVRACVETKTHYVDISAELYHMIHLYRIYHKVAEEANVLIVPACGFAAVPVETGIAYLEKKFNGTLNTVEGYFDIILPKRANFPGKCVIHFGTWASLVQELQNLREYQRLKAETFPQNIYIPEPPGFKRSFFHRQRGKFWFPYPGPDRDVNDMSQRYLYEKNGKKPYHCKLYTKTPMFFQMLIIVPAMFLYFYLCYFKFFRNWLVKYPRFFSLGYVSHKGPTEKIAKETKFKLSLLGKGVGSDSKEKSLTVQVSGADPGYETTSIAVVVSALTILLQNDKIPKGGVLGVGAAFRDTNIDEMLMKNKGLQYEILN